MRRPLVPSVAATVLALAVQAWAGGRVVLPPIAAPVGAPGFAPVTAVASALGPVSVGAQVLQLPLSLPLPAVLRHAPLPGPGPVGAPVGLGGLAAALAPHVERAPSAEVAALAAARGFDGSRQRPESVQLLLPFSDFRDIPPPAKTAEPPVYLSIADPKQRQWLAQVVREAWNSRAGRKVLRDAAQLAVQLGHPITVVVSDLRSNNGEYVYDWDVVRMGAHYMKKPPLDAAPTLIHELLHVVQKAQLLPVDAFEMELEAYGVTFEVMRELGTAFEKNTFYRAAYKKFRGPLPEYLKWLVSEYKGNIPLVTSRLSAYVKAVEAQRDRTRKQLARMDLKIKDADAVIAEMRRTGQDERAVEHYRLDVIGKLELDRRGIAQALAWNERDLNLLATPEGRERYRAFARRVMDYTRRLHARYNADPSAADPLK